MNALTGLFLTCCAHLSKLLAGFILIKLAAYYLGAEGLGGIGHFMSLVAIVYMLSGGGILNGVIKYVAEYKYSPKKLLRFIKASTIYAAYFSLIISIVGVIFCSKISTFLFNDGKYYWIVITLAIAQLGFAFSTIVIGVVNGFRATKTYAFIQIGGAIIALPIMYVLIRFFGMPGAALAVLALYFFYLVPAYFVFCNSIFYKKISNLKPLKSDFKNLSLFTLMLFASSIAFPVIEILTREYLISSSGYKVAGLWQGCIKLSSAYIGFFSVFLGAYFMPIIVSEKNKEQLRKKVFSFMAFIASIFVFGAFILYNFRDFFVPFLLSTDFLPLNDLIIFQLVGDGFKVTAYVIGYVAVAKAATKLYIFAELLQSSMFFGGLVLLSQKIAPLEAVFTSYALAYAIYFAVSLSVFVYWTRK